MLSFMIFLLLSIIFYCSDEQIAIEIVLVDDFENDSDLLLYADLIILINRTPSMYNILYFTKTKVT